VRISSKCYSSILIGTMLQYLLSDSRQVATRKALGVRKSSGRWMICANASCLVRIEQLEKRLADLEGTTLPHRPPGPNGGHQRSNCSGSCPDASDLVGGANRFQAVWWTVITTSISTILRPCPTSCITSM